MRSHYRRWSLIACLVGGVGCSAPAPTGSPPALPPRVGRGEPIAVPPEQPERHEVPAARTERPIDDPPPARGPAVRGLALLQLRQDDEAWTELQQCIVRHPELRDDILSDAIRVLRGRAPTVVDARRPKTITPDEFRAAIRERFGAREAEAFANPTECTPEMTRRAAAMVKNAEGDLERARMLFAVVEARAGANEPGSRTAPEVFRDWDRADARFKGCVEGSVLFVALARAAGVSAFLVDVDEPMCGRPFHRTVIGWSGHVCAVAFVDDKAVLVDPALHLFGAPHRAFRVADDFQAAKLVYLNRGCARQAMGDLDGAVAEETKAVEIDPRYAPAYYNRGTARSAKGDLDGAAADYTKAVEIDAGFAPAYYNRGNARQAKGDLDGAVADFTKAIETEPRRLADGTGPALITLAYMNRGNARNAKGDRDGAIADYTAGIETDPRFADVRCNRGSVRAEKGDQTGALSDFTSAIEINPRYFPAYCSRGMLRSIRGDLDGAVADLTKALELEPRNAGVLFSRGLVRLRQRNEAEARKDFDAGLKLRPDLKPALDRAVEEARNR